MRIGIYDPYLDSLGGGERYVLTAASYLSQKHNIEIFWDDTSVISEAQKKLNIDLSNVLITSNIFSSKNTIDKALRTKAFDCIIFLSDGSVPLLLSKKSILIFQFPVNWVKGRSFANRLKMTNISDVVCYTDFVKKYLDKTFNINSKVLYPPVIEEINNSSIKKENIILNVGRFTKAMNMKKQDVLIREFVKLHESGVKNWKLLLLGSYLPGDSDYVDKIKKIAQGYPIEIKTNASYSELLKYYHKAKIYWHAAGYGEDLELHPERAEHFGITTVEAMGAGAVPVVINAGGQPEIVENNKSGFLWDTLEELQKNTKELIGDELLMNKMADQARIRAKDFSEKKFFSNLEKILI